MKKLIYMLSLTIGLVLAGCAQWEKPEPQSPDNFGAACEMVVTVDSVVTTSSTTLTIETVGAKYVSYLLSESVISNVNYTYILQGKMGAKLTETDVEGEVINTELKNLEAGMVYTLYVVAANEQGRQTTFSQSIQTVDETAPAIKNPLEALKPTKDGLKATVVFNENIKRTEGMGDITYDIFLLDKANKQFVAIAEDALIASASASGANLTVSLPAATEFEMGVDYIVLLSFAEGAVEDLFGNKMAAIENGIVNNKPTGPFWNVLLEEQGEEPEEEGSFFADGKKYGYAFGIAFSDEEDYQQTGTGFRAWTLIDNNYENEQVGTCQLWAISSMFDFFKDNEEAGVSPNHEIPAITYVAEVEPDYETECVSIITFDKELPTLGQMYLKLKDGSEGNFDIYPGQWDINNEYGQGAEMLFIGWDFALYEFNSQGYKFPGLAYVGVQPVLFFLNDGNPGILATVDGESFQIFREDLLPSGSAKVTMLDEPIKLSKDNIKVLDRSNIKSLKLAK